jgi:hypothetical protein
MKNTIKYSIGLVSMAFLLSYCDSEKKPDVPDPPKTPSMSAADVSGAACTPLVLEPSFLLDVDILNQQCVNTFAWQYFINMTWPGKDGLPDPSKNIKDWGVPGDLSYMVFDTYMSAEDVFKTTAPGSWGSRIKDPVTSLKLINNTHKFNDEDIITEFFQAAGGKTPWLTDQEGNLIWYEELMNEVEFDYIKDNKFYIPQAQHDSCVNGGPGIWLPNGSIELKASWRIIPEDQFETLKHRYKIIEAMIPDSIYIQGDSTVIASSTMKQQKLGLVGLHIIHKTPSTPQFIWATFEHVDLAPETSTCISDKVDWLLYNPENCETTPNVAPNPKTQSLTDPSQIIKDPVASPQKDAMNLNSYVHTLIKAQNPTSVFQYYKLVGSQWPAGAVADGDNNTYTPLEDGGKTPIVLTNVSMESYVQKLSCLTCHVGAGVTKKLPNGKELPSDYSFLFGKAQIQEK